MSTSNYVLFSAEGKIRRYEEETQILADFFKLRSDLYMKRKAFMLCNLQREFELLQNKCSFIKAIVSGDLVVNRVKKQTIITNMQRLGLKPLSKINAILKDFKMKVEGEDEEAAPEESPDPMGKDYDYLLSMPLLSLSEERASELERQMQLKKTERDSLEKKHHFALWEADLDDFMAALDKYEAKEEADRLASNKPKGKGRAGLQEIPKVGVKRSKAEASMFDKLSLLAEDESPVRKRKRVME
jgi:DNA topoisomerase-2